MNANQTPSIRSIPGTVLFSVPSFASLLLIAANDLWLKRVHPGFWSGKLSDIGLCILLPLFVSAAMSWAEAAIGLLSVRFAPSDSFRAAAACLIADVYFVLVKVWPAATRAHVTILSSLFPSHHFRAVTDPTDLICLPFTVIAFLTIRDWYRASA